MRLENLLVENIEKDTVVDNASKALLKVFSKYPMPDQLYKAILFTLMQAIEYHSDVDGFEYMKKFAQKILRGDNFPLNKDVIYKIMDKNKKDIDMTNDDDYETSEEISLNGVTINKRTRVVHFENENKTIRLGRKGFELLYLLMKKSDKVLNRDYILSIVWPESDVNERAVDVAISKIRNEMPLNYRKLIQGISGGGYVFDTTK